MTAYALRNSASAAGRTKEPTEIPVPEQKQDAGVHRKADADAPASLRGAKRSLVIIAVLVGAAGGRGRVCVVVPRSPEQRADRTCFVRKYRFAAGCAPVQ